MANINSQLENIPRDGKDSAFSARARLVEQRRELGKTMRERVTRFWHGNQGNRNGD